MRDEQLIARTYTRAWNQEHVIWRIERVPLPFPVTFRQIGVFVVVLGVVWPLYWIPWTGAWLVWLGLLPALTTLLVYAQGIQIDDGSLPAWGRLAIIGSSSVLLWLLIKAAFALGHALPLGWFLLLPMLLTWFLTRQSLDGRNPLKFVWAFLCYLIHPKRLNRYEPQERRRKFSCVAQVQTRRPKPGLLAGIRRPSEGGKHSAVPHQLLRR